MVSKATPKADSGRKPSPQHFSGYLVLQLKHLWIYDVLTMFVQLLDPRTVQRLRPAFFPHFSLTSLERKTRNISFLFRHNSHSDSPKGQEVSTGECVKKPATLIIFLLLHKAPKWRVGTTMEKTAAPMGTIVPSNKYIKAEAGEPIGARRNRKTKRRWRYHFRWKRGTFLVCFSWFRLQRTHTELSIPCPSR